MRFLATLLTALALTGCASAPPMPAADDLFHDAQFRPPNPPIDASAALATSPAMHRYLRAKMANTLRGVDRRQMLIDALSHGDLRLEYDAAITRTAAEAFDARSGNCMALVLMSSAFARELGLKVQYQAVLGEESWDRTNGLYIAVGHVNLLVEEPRDAGRVSTAGPLVVDFLPSSDAQRLVTRSIEEKTVIAMFLNNRAVESLTRGEVDAAYWWTRAAIQSDPELLVGYVTLGVVYRSHHLPAFAEAALERVANREPDNLFALSNRVLALRDLGRDTDAAALARRLDQLDPHPPFSYFQQGVKALKEGHPEAARRFFAKEIERAPYHHEFEFWLAVSYIQLNDVTRATLHLQRAMEVSTTRKDHDLYAAKLERLRALDGH